MTWGDLWRRFVALSRASVLDAWRRATRRKSKPSPQGVEAKYKRPVVCLHDEFGAVLATSPANLKPGTNLVVFRGIRETFVVAYWSVQGHDWMGGHLRDGAGTWYVRVGAGDEVGLTIVIDHQEHDAPREAWQ